MLPAASSGGLVNNISSFVRKLEVLYIIFWSMVECHVRHRELQVNKGGALVAAGVASLLGVCGSKRSLPQRAKQARSATDGGLQVVWTSPCTTDSKRSLWSYG